MRPSLYCRLYSDLSDHPKLVAAIDHYGGDSRRQAYGALSGLWMHLACWTTRQMMDGFVPEDMIAHALSDEPARACAALVAAGILEIVHRGHTRGVQFHDWAEHNASATEIKRRRQLEREKKARWRLRKQQRNVHGGQHGGLPPDIPVDAVDTPANQKSVRKAKKSESLGKHGQNGHLSTVPSTVLSTVDKMGKMYPLDQEQDRVEYRGSIGDLNPSKIETQKAGQGRRAPAVAIPGRRATAALPRPAPPSAEITERQEPRAPSCPHAAQHAWCSTAIRFGFCVEADQHAEFIERGAEDTALRAFYVSTVDVDRHPPPAKRYAYWRKHVHAWLRTRPAPEPVIERPFVACTLPTEPALPEWRYECLEKHWAKCKGNRELHEERLKNGWKPES